MERSPTNVMNKLNSEWLKEIPQAPTEISESTARRWMYFLVVIAFVIWMDIVKVLSGLNWTTLYGNIEAIV